MLSILHSPARGYDSGINHPENAMPTIKILNRYTNAALFEHETTDERISSGLAMRDALESACRSGANLTNAYLADADLSGANLTDANLSGAYLSGANLTNADLSYANLSYANLTGANLTNANLSGAYLSYADLTGAYLAGANLTNAYLADANLTGTNLTGAYLTGAKWNGRPITVQPLQLFGMKWRVMILDADMQIGCQTHSLAEWAAFDDAQIAAMDGKDALRFWRAHKDLLLGLARANGREF